MLQLSAPRIIERGPYQVVGAYCTFEGDDEGPGWTGAEKAFFSRRQEITNRIGDLTLGFLYRPCQDHAEIDESVRSCFIGVEVSDLKHVPQGMATTHFSGGKYVIVECWGDSEEEAAMGVGEAIGYLVEKWMPEHGYTEGEACFAASPERSEKPPYIEYVYIKIEQ
jgi:predicted transcriptional regulator YdeE